MRFMRTAAAARKIKARAVGGHAFIVFGEAAVAPKPGKRALHDPAALLHDEAALVWRFGGLVTTSIVMAWRRRRLPR